MYDLKYIYQAQTAEHAVELLCAHPEARIIAGGSDVLIAMREGKHTDLEWVSLQSAKDLKYIRLSGNGQLQIGAMSTFSDVIENTVIREKMTVLAEACQQVGSRQIRNIGTLGGNTCNGVTSADSAATLLAHNAWVHLLGPEGEREITLEKFYTGAGKVDLRSGEIETEIVINKEDYWGFSGAYYKYAVRKALDIANCSCSVSVKMEDDGKTVAACRAAYGVAGPVPLRVREAEDWVQGKELTPKVIEVFAEKAMGQWHTRDSWRASKEFRDHMLFEMTKRMLDKAAIRWRLMYNAEAICRAESDDQWGIIL